MNPIKKISLVEVLLGVAILCFVAGFVAPCQVHGAADPSGIFTLPGVESTGFDSPYIVSKSRLNAALPATVAVSTFGWFSNVTARVVQGSDVAITLTYSGAGITNVTPSNQVLYVDLSPDGRVWATNSPLTRSFSPATNGALTMATIQFIIFETNFGPNAFLRVRGVTNPGSTGNGSLTLSNVVISSWRPQTYRR